MNASTKALRLKAEAKARRDVVRRFKGLCRWRTDCKVDWQPDWRYATVDTTLTGAVMDGRRKCWRYVERVSLAVTAQRVLPVPREVDGFLVLAVDGRPTRTGQPCRAVLVSRVKAGLRTYRIRYGFVDVVNGAAGAGATALAATTNAQKANCVATRTLLEVSCIAQSSSVKKVRL